MKGKKLIIIGAVCVLIVIGALAAVPFFIDTQSLKTKLVTEAEGILHRRMSVQAVEITVFTGLGVRLNRAVIFDDLRIRECTVRLAQFSHRATAAVAAVARHRGSRQHRAGTARDPTHPEPGPHLEL